jgi:pimeloyl-ACP methyl ester carboxylesterase
MMKTRFVVMVLSAAILSHGCSVATEDLADDALHRARLRVSPTVLQQYVGTYRLASGAHFSVTFDGQRLLGGTPPDELLPQTTRQFSSNRAPGEFHFERAGPDAAVNLRRRLGKRDYLCERIDPSIVPDPTRRVSAGKHDVRMLITGTGSPTIVLEDGLGTGIEYQAELQADLSKFTTTVTYDHAGTGGSESGPLPRDARRIAYELRQALRSASLEPPFILVGGSIGGDYIRVFAHEFPEETSGLILLDPTPDWDQLMEWAEGHSPSHVAMYREFVRDAETIMNRLMSVQEAGRAAEWDVLATTRAQARQALPLSAIPIVQITGAGGRSLSSGIADKTAFFEDWLQHNLPHAKHVLATHSGHAVTITDRQLVIDEVGQMVKTLRNARASHCD